MMAHYLFGGISDAILEVEKFELAGGVAIARTYAHLMAHFMLAFKPPLPKAHHPGPWKSANAGLVFDVEAEISAPSELNIPDWFDAVNSIWWTVALLRMRVSPSIRLPALSSISFSRMSEPEQEARVSVMEVQSRGLLPPTKQPARISAKDLEWLSVHWLGGGRLFREHPNFANAFIAFDQSILTASHGLGLVQLWGAFELLFATSRHRKTHQLASRISAYLEPPGETRAALRNQVIELYHSRSDAAHGAPANQEVAFYTSYELLKRVLRRNLEEQYVLMVGDLERLSQPEALHRVH